MGKLPHMWGQSLYILGSLMAEVRGNFKALLLFCFSHHNKQIFVSSSFVSASFPGGSVVRICLPMQETQVQFLGQEGPLEKEMTTYSSILAWENPWTEEPGRLQSMGRKRVRHSSATKQQQYL